MVGFRSRKQAIRIVKQNLSGSIIGHGSIKLYGTVPLAKNEFISGGGPKGVDGRTPYFQTLSSHNEVSITDPFILYQNYISQGLLEKDESQLRAMKEFQKLYQRVLNYKPPEDLQIKISLLLRKIELKQAEKYIKEKNETGSSMYPIKLSALNKLFARDPDAEKKQLIRIMTDEEELSEFNSPQGLLVNGEVGCGKSMLMDIFASSLPHESKMRWHFNNFILWVFNEIHKIQNEKVITSTLKNGRQQIKLTMENEFILFEIAQKMINKNTILMLDEFMLPDIASANIIKILFTYYFKLGGVLVATSNKLPEDLYSNQFHKSNFKSFVNILNYRCKSIDMRSSKDYRVHFASQNLSASHLVVKHENPENDLQWLELLKSKVLNIPLNSNLMDKDISLNDPKLVGKDSSINVYNRVTKLPLTFDEGICYLDFDYICRGLYSASDYITLSSQYRTIILDNVPILTTKMKNEARRFITLLDAIYESKCQLYIRSDVLVDHIFFPDASESNAPEEIKQMAKDLDNNNLQVQDEEMYAKTSIDISNPYRPNVSTYDQDHTVEFKESIKDKETEDNFKNIKAFTGEDEKFAYKRAILRIKEMLGSEFWRQNDRWVPIDKSMRPWESKHQLLRDPHTISTSVKESTSTEDSPALENQIKSIVRDKQQWLDSLPRDMSREMNVPFRTFNAKFAPVFSNIQHFWAMGKWNRNIKSLKDDIAKSWLNSSNNDKS